MKIEKGLTVCTTVHLAERRHSCGMIVCTTVYLPERSSHGLTICTTVYLAERRQPWLDRLYNCSPD